MKWRHDEVFILFFLTCLLNLPKTTCSIESLQADSPLNVLQNMQIWKPSDKKWRHNDVITKNNERQWESADFVGTKQNIFRSKGFEESYSKM